MTLSVSVCVLVPGLWAGGRRISLALTGRALGSTLGWPSDPQDLGVREGAIGKYGQSTASPIDARSLSPILADGALGGRKRPLPASDSLPEGWHQPGSSHLHQGRSLPGKRGCGPRASRQEANEVGLVWRTVDPSLLDDTTLTGDTSLSIDQVVLCLRSMLTMVPSGHAPRCSEFPSLAH